MEYRLWLPLSLFALALEPAAAAWQAPTVEASAIEVPTLDFTPTPAIERDYDKYFYFHRADTDYPTALADFRECDAYARGISIHTQGGASGPLVGLATDAIFGAAQRRDISRRNLRVCMNFKEYRRYGLTRSLWGQIHDSELPGETGEARRERRLRIQARLASGPQPRIGAIAQ